jgi:hypothetical protein
MLHDTRMLHEASSPQWGGTQSVCVDLLTNVHDVVSGGDDPSLFSRRDLRPRYSKYTSASNSLIFLWMSHTRYESPYALAMTSTLDSSLGLPAIQSALFSPKRF